MCPPFTGRAHKQKGSSAQAQKSPSLHITKAYWQTVVVAVVTKSYH